MTKPIPFPTPAYRDAKLERLTRVSIALAAHERAVYGAFEALREAEAALNEAILEAGNISSLHKDAPAFTDWTSPYVRTQLQQMRQRLYSLQQSGYKFRAALDAQIKTA